MYLLLVNTLYQRFALKAVKTEYVVSNTSEICSNLLCKNSVHHILSLHRRSSPIHPHVQKIKILLVINQLNAQNLVL